MNRDEWSPVDVSWGFERRTSAVRAVTQPFPSGVRLEHRVSGADTNPYLVILAALGGGLRGIEQRIEPGPPETSQDEAASRWPTTCSPRSRRFRTPRRRGRSSARDSSTIT